MLIRWKSDDDEEWLGWLPEQNMHEDEPTYLVMSPEPNVWAGWRYNEDRSRDCVTHDFTCAHEAKDACEFDEQWRRLTPGTYYPGGTDR